MTDLTGPDLALAVARVMDDANIAAIWGSFAYSDYDADELFDPINNGSDFDAVLMWGLNHRRPRDAIINTLREITTEVPHGIPDIESAVIRRAVCRAVALGDCQGSKSG